MMKYLNHVPFAVCALALVACGGAASPHSDNGIATTPGEPLSEGVYGASVEAGIAAVRTATAAFRSLDSAVEAGYPRSVPNCLSHPELGAMGYHHVNPQLVDDRIEVERPEILVSSRTPSGEYVLNGVEYIVPYSVRPRDATPPTVMGQELKPSDPLEIWYLHVWIWNDNPSGLFADWNPEVECPS